MVLDLFLLSFFDFFELMLLIGGLFSLKLCFFLLFFLVFLKFGVGHLRLKIRCVLGHVCFSLHSVSLFRAFVGFSRSLRRHGRACSLLLGVSCGFLSRSFQLRFVGLFLLLFLLLLSLGLLFCLFVIGLILCVCFIGRALSFNIRGNFLLELSLVDR